MKKKILAAASILAFAISGAAFSMADQTMGEKNSTVDSEKRTTIRYDRRHPRYRHRPYPRRHQDRTVVVTTCAPEVLNGNIEATERVLGDLANSAEFANATTFKSLVSSIKAETDTQKKVDAYFGLVGVETTEDMAYFVGARDEELRDYAAVLASNAELSQPQAEKVATKLATSLRGGMR